MFASSILLSVPATLRVCRQGPLQVSRDALAYRASATPGLQRRPRCLHLSQSLRMRMPRLHCGCSRYPPHRSQPAIPNTVSAYLFTNDKGAHSCCARVWSIDCPNRICLSVIKPCCDAGGQRAPTPTPSPGKAAGLERGGHCSTHSDPHAFGCIIVTAQEFARTAAASARPPPRLAAPGRRRPSLRSCAATWLRLRPPGSSSAMRSSMSFSALCASNNSCSRSRCACHYAASAKIRAAIRA